MNFGVNLPGPFRVGVSSKGRVNVGMSLGPFSVSTSTATTTRRRATPGLELPEGAVPLTGTVAQHVAQAVTEGWTVTGYDATTTFLRRDKRRIRLDQITPNLIAVSALPSRWKMFATVMIFAVPLTVCWLALELR